MRDAFTTVDSGRAAAVGGLFDAPGIFVSTNSVDLSSFSASNPRDIGRGNPIVMKFKVETAFVGNGTLQIGVIASSEVALSGGTELIVSMSGSIKIFTLGGFGLFTAATLTAGAEVVLYVNPFPPTLIGTAIGLQYLGGVYLMDSGSFTAGTFSTAFYQGDGGASNPPVRPIAYAGP